jgi:hypothetical protein
MSAQDILAELPNLSSEKRARIFEALHDLTASK